MKNKFFEDVELREDEEFTEETLKELSDGRGEDEE